MRNLPPPSVLGAESDLKSAVKSYTYRKIKKGHDITEEEAKDILHLYAQYDESLGSVTRALQLALPNPGPLSESIHAAYEKTYEKRVLFPLREMLFSGAGQCPLCGIRDAIVLDHFLPRSDFKALSIYAKNLIPTCQECNHIKLDYFAEDASSHENYVHAYLDHLPNENFIVAKPSIKESSLVVGYEVGEENSLPELMRKRISFQIKKLNLNERYEAEISTLLTGHSISLRVIYEIGGAASVSRFLVKQAEVEQSAFHRNHWRPTLLFALSEHQDFIEGGFANLIHQHPASESMYQEILGA
ncbi:MAG: HNH endonuclease signature motif containing protein [Stenotrophomonas indicatrix]|uniref:HNH endonuclease signature motif containing protein n=1 Tax=Stenotrophomonas indicatrix TaxID=2045451 RepID=UPI003C7A25F2